MFQILRLIYWKILSHIVCDLLYYDKAFINNYVYFLPHSIFIMNFIFCWMRRHISAISSQTSYEQVTYRLIQSAILQENATSDWILIIHCSRLQFVAPILIYYLNICYSGEFTLRQNEIVLLIAVQSRLSKHKPAESLVLVVKQSQEIKQLY